MIARTKPKWFQQAWWHSYLVAVFGTPLLVWLLPAPVRGVPFPITTVVLIPIMVSAFFGGFLPALVAIVCAIATVEFSAWGNYDRLGLSVSASFEIGRWTVFVLVALMVAALMEFAHRARRRVETNEVKLGSTLANIDEAVIVTNREGLIEYVNPAATMLLPAGNETVLGKSFDEVFHIVDVVTGSPGEEFPKLIRARAQTQIRVNRYALLSKSGRRIPLEVTIAPIRDGEQYSGNTVITLRDCSERQRTEDALHERIALQEQLAAIANMLPGALHSVRMFADGSAVLTYASPSFADVFGMDPEPLFQDAHRMRAIIYPDDLSWLDSLVRQSVSGLKPLRLEHRVLHPTKGVIWIELYAAPVPEPNGSTLWNGVFFDITQRKQAEHSLKQSEARLLGIVDAAMDAIVTMDDQQGIVVFNPAAEHMFRCTETGMLGLTLENFVSGYLHADSGLLLNVLRRNEISDLRLGELSNLYGRRSDGETFPLELSVSRTEVDGHRLLSMTLRDIAERKRAADRLQVSQQQLRAALEAGSMGVMKLYTKSREVEFDEQALEQCGVKCAPHVRQPLAVLLEALHVDDRRRLMREYLVAIRRRTAFRTECRVIHDGDKVCWLVLRGGVLIEDGTQEAQLMAIVTDVTYRKLLEEQRLRSQKLESLGVLAGGIAHDFNNLLLAITGNLKLAVADVRESHPAMASLREIGKAAARATDLVRRILAFSRPQDHKREPVTLDAMIEEVLGLARAVLPAAIAIRVFTSETSPVVLADATQVHQVLINLLTNAADAVPPTGGEIRIHLDVVNADAHLHGAAAQLQAGRRYARITVSDNGAGMDVATLQRIFDPFYTTKPFGQGTGLGLAIVHGIMKGHEGAVLVNSEVGHGSSFALYFPVYTAAMPSLPPVATPVREMKHGHILYVDDEEALVYLMTRTLQRMGHEVTGRVEPEQALAAFMKNPNAFDLVVSDMSMPGMSGLEFARKILEVNSQVPVIITTGFVRAEDYAAATAAGVRQLILKPNTIEELGVTIERVLQSKEMEAPVKSA